MVQNFFSGNGSLGVTTANIMLQATGSIGGTRAVFVDVGGQTNDLVMPTFGGQWANPFKGPSKFYAGDLFEIRTDDKGEKPKIYLLKTFKVAVTGEGPTYKIEKDGFHHIPFVGDILMKAPDKIGGQGKAYTLTGVKSAVHEQKEVWEITFNTTLGSLTAGDVLVEADKENASTANMLVKTINGVAPMDNDFIYYPMSGDATNMDNVHVNYAPTLHGLMYIHKMSPMPKCVLNLNKSRVNGWYEV